MPTIGSGISANVVWIMPVGSSVSVRLIVSSMSEITSHPSGAANEVFIVMGSSLKSCSRGRITAPSSMPRWPSSTVWLIMPFRSDGPRPCDWLGLEMGIWRVRVRDGETASTNGWMRCSIRLRAS